MHYMNLVLEIGRYANLVMKYMESFASWMKNRGEMAFVIGKLMKYTKEGHTP